MFLLSYHLTNWGPHREQNLVFPREAKTVALIAENDQGKSWVVRGIAFCLSIGRNEYGDQTAILDGETESYHKLTFEHNGQEHTIEKIVRNKKSEEEGTTTLINGQPADRASFEEFYKTTLGLPHPSVWLPIMVAMQNETDAHLRRKKSEREAALRAACQLTRVDSWKEALQARTNDEDKALIAEKASLKTRTEGLIREIHEIDTELKELETRLVNLNQPFGDEGPTLTDIITQVRVFDEAVSSKTRLELDLENKSQDLKLAETAKTRAEEVLAGLPGGSAEEEAKELEIVEQVQGELKAREKSVLDLKLLRSVQGGNKLRKELAALPSPESVDPDEIDQAVANATAMLDLSEEKRKECETLGVEITPETVASLKEDAGVWETQATTHQTDATRIETWGREITNTLATCQSEIADLAGETDPAKALVLCTKLAAEIAGETGKGPLGKAEATEITLRVLQHWDEHPHENCPVCDQAMKGLPTFSNPKLREAMIQGLLEEKEDHAKAAKQKQAIAKAILRLENAVEQQENLRTAGAWPNWQETAEKLRSKATSSSKTATTLKATAKTVEDTLSSAARLETSIQNLRSLLVEKPAEADTKTETVAILQAAARELAKKVREAKSQRAIIQTKIDANVRETTELEQQLVKFQNVGEPDPNMAGKQDDELATLLEETQKKIKSLRENRHARTNAEKEFTAAKTRLANAKEAADKAANELAKVLEIIRSGAGMPQHPSDPEGTKAAAAELWKDAEHERAGVTARIDPLKERKKLRETEQEETQKTLLAIETRVARAQAARNLIKFLDYKNAPRKLLASICERLFESSNRIAEALNADIRLKVGRDLDFLTLQHRQGRLIEQRTERLGFGKGAVLGICFRLACQKLLLPDTGFLILDEPTANVDSKRKNALKAFLQNLSEETESKIKQIILIEHDADVIELCQAKIRVGEMAA